VSLPIYDSASRSFCCISASWFERSPAAIPFCWIILLRRSISAFKSSIWRSLWLMIWSLSVMSYSFETICSLKASSSMSLSANNCWTWLIWSIKSALCLSRISLALVCSWSRAYFTVSFSLNCHSFTVAFTAASAYALSSSSELSFSIKRSLYFLLCS